MIGAGKFALPSLRFTLVVFDIEVHDGVRIYELKTRDCSTHGDCFRGVVPRLTVMR
jgi:hypothetical protein